MKAKKDMMKRGLVKLVMSLVLAGGAVSAVSGCDEYLDYFTDFSSAGFRMGNFNQGLSGHVDCSRNPLDPRC